MDSKLPLVSVSLLSADWFCLKEEVTYLQKAGADYLHMDIMDGHFVPPITFGDSFVKAVWQKTTLPLDVHLMIRDVDRHLDRFAQSGAHILTIHPETTSHLHKSLVKIRSLGCKAGVALNPGTPLNCLEDSLPMIDLILIMTVEPGFSGQAYIPHMTQKIHKARALIDRSGLPIRLQVDGGINAETAPISRSAGADILVAGSFILSGHRTALYKSKIAALKGIQ